MLRAAALSSRRLARAGAPLRAAPAGLRLRRAAPAAQARHLGFMSEFGEALKKEFTGKGAKGEAAAAAGAEGPAAAAARDDEGEEVRAAAARAEEQVEEEAAAAAAADPQDAAEQEGAEQEDEAEAEPQPDAKAKAKEAAAGAGMRWQSFRAGLAEAADGLFKPARQSSSITQQVEILDPSSPEYAARLAAEEERAKQRAADPDAPQVVALTLAKEGESMWDKIGERLRDTPIIQSILDAAGKVRESPVGDAAHKVKSVASDRVEDVREAWETSQNPWVYRASSIYDTFFAETETSIALRELRRLEPGFVIEDWRDQVAETVLPQLIAAFLEGDAIKLKQWLSEGAYAMVGAHIKDRKVHGLVVDPTILALRNVEVLAARAEQRGAPIVVLQLMAQQINCVRNREGEIVEGSDDEVVAAHYALAFQRSYDPEAAELRWRVVEFSSLGALPYY